MPAISILGGLNQEASQQELLTQMTLLLAAMLEKMPRVDGNDRVIVGIETGAVSINTGQTLATLTTLGDAVRLQNMGSSGWSRPADAIPLHLANAGAMHIYNNIQVS